MIHITTFFDQEEKKILNSVEKIHKLLVHLRYEGKVYRKKNIKLIVNAIDPIFSSLKRHYKLQEQIIFPFIETRIPKHDSIIHFLRTDHQLIVKYKAKLHGLLKKAFKQSTNGKGDGIIQQIGVYWICLLRHHLELEKQSIHKAIKKEFRNDEKKEMREKIMKCLRKE